MVIRIFDDAILRRSHFVNAYLQLDGKNESWRQSKIKSFEIQ
jgi:hypothetical protein